MSNRNAILLRPQWVVNNQLTLPLVTNTAEGRTSIKGLVQVMIPITIFLDTLIDVKEGYYNRRSSMGRDQLQIFKSVEGALQVAGVDGKSCLLRTICEMQRHPIGEFSILGEIVTILLTPKRGMSDFLHDYLEAERIGQSNDMSCATEFPTCPVSLYNIFRSYSTPEDKPDGSASDADHSSQPPDQYDYYDAEAKDTYGPPLASDRFHSPKEPHDNNIDSTK